MTSFPDFWALPLSLALDLSPDCHTPPSIVFLGVPGKLFIHCVGVCLGSQGHRPVKVQYCCQRCISLMHCLSRNWREFKYCMCCRNTGRFTAKCIFDIKPCACQKLWTEGVKFSAEKITRYFKHGINKLLVFILALFWKQVWGLKQFYKKPKICYRKFGLE